jgi:lipopolysaccharide export system protein LptA
MFIIIVLASIISFAGVSNPSWAEQSFDRIGNSKEPIEIEASTLEVLQNQQKAIFSGNVIATQGAVTMRSQTMTVFYKSGSGENAGGLSSGISKLEVAGNVRLNTPTESAEGNTGSYNVDAGLITLNGNVLLKRGKNVIKGDRLEYNVKSGKSQVVSNPSANVGETSSGGRVKAVFVPESKN